MSAEITIVSPKPNVRTLWLDTSIGIKLAKLKRGETLQQVERERAERLFSLVEKLVGAGKLLCPEADQNEEFEAAFNELRDAVRANESGNNFYALHRSRDDSQSYIVLEQYVDQAALDGHGKSDHFKASGAKLWRNH